jgi:hypothetical protein
MTSEVGALIHSNCTHKSTWEANSRSAGPYPEPDESSSYPFPHFVPNIRRGADTARVFIRHDPPLPIASFPNVSLSSVSSNMLGPCADPYNTRITADSHSRLCSPCGLHTQIDNQVAHNCYLDCEDFLLLAGMQTQLSRSVAATEAQVPVRRVGIPQT